MKLLTSYGHDRARFNLLSRCTAGVHLSGTGFMMPMSCSEHRSQHVRFPAICVQSSQPRTASKTLSRVSVEIPVEGAPCLPHITTVFCLF